MISATKQNESSRDIYKRLSALSVRQQLVVLMELRDRETDMVRHISTGHKFMLPLVGLSAIISLVAYAISALTGDGIHIAVHALHIIAIYAPCKAVSEIRESLLRSKSFVDELRECQHSVIAGIVGSFEAQKKQNLEG